MNAYSSTYWVTKNYLLILVDDWMKDCHINSSFYKYIKQVSSYKSQKF